MLGGFSPPNTPARGGLRFPHPKSKRPQAPDTFGLNPSSQMVTRYHWLSFRNQVLTTNFEYKIDHISKTKNHKIVKLSAKFVSEHCAFFGTNFFRRFQEFWTTISQKLKIGKLIFYPFQNMRLRQLFGSKNKICTFCGGRGVCMSSTRTGPCRVISIKNNECLINIPINSLTF